MEQILLEGCWRHQTYESWNVYQPKKKKRDKKEMRELVRKNRCILKSTIYLHYVNLYFESGKKKSVGLKPCCNEISNWHSLREIQNGASEVSNIDLGYKRNIFIQKILRDSLAQARQSTWFETSKRDSGFLYLSPIPIQHGYIWWNTVTFKLETLFIPLLAFFVYYSRCVIT